MGKEETIGKGTMGMFIAIIMMLIMAQLVRGSTPQPQYTCPVCGEKFMTYEELYNHFTSEHPAESIDIIWE